jgi:hypothetical protein
MRFELSWNVAKEVTVAGFVGFIWNNRRFIIAYIRDRTKETQKKLARDDC